jgi:hypothetical protein
MKIGLIDVDGHNFPNFALMKISAWHKSHGNEVHWYNPMFTGHCDRVYMSKVFTFSSDYEFHVDADEIIRGGTGYDIKSVLPQEIEDSTLMDYSIYPQYPFSVVFLSRGCIRDCPFCLVREKEGYIKPVTPVDLNPNGKWIEVLDNNFFANPNWHEAVEWIMRSKQKVKLHGVDIRIMNEEQAAALKMMKHYRQPHIAWDLPKLDLQPQLETFARYIRSSSITCYVLIGFNSTIEQDLHRVRVLKKMRYTPFVQAYRDFENKRQRTWYEVDFARWANNRFFLNSCDFVDFEPRKGFKCGEYLDNPELMNLKFDKKHPPYKRKQVL